MLCLKVSPHTLRPVPLSREAGVAAVVGEEEEEGLMVAIDLLGTTPVINPQHHISHHTQIVHVRDTMETLLQIEGKD